MIMTRVRAESDLRTWGLRLREKIGFKRAAVAVARKLAVIMHAEVGRDVQPDHRHRLIRKLECTCPRCAEASLPGRSANHSAESVASTRSKRLVACVSHHGRFTREAPSCGGLMSTAKTTVLPANDASAKRTCILSCD